MALFGKHVQLNAHFLHFLAFLTLASLALYGAPQIPSQQFFVLLGTPTVVHHILTLQLHQLTLQELVLLPQSRVLV